MPDGFRPAARFCGIGQGECLTERRSRVYRMTKGSGIGASLVRSQTVLTVV